MFISHTILNARDCSSCLDPYSWWDDATAQHNSAGVVGVKLHQQSAGEYGGGRLAQQGPQILSMLCTIIVTDGGMFTALPALNLGVQRRERYNRVAQHSGHQNWPTGDSKQKLILSTIFIGYRLLKVEGWCRGRLNEEKRFFSTSAREYEIM